jgi:UDP-N-acetylmuramoyl-L-alanyl-D-glutamate--2,6-diaminopimelate ligase
VELGAAAVVAEHAIPGVAVPQVLVPVARPALALAAAWLHEYPSRRLGVVGITGTDGKTTTSFMVRAILAAAGEPAGLVGTVDVIVGGQALGNVSRATTPEAPQLQAYLAAMVARGDRWAVVESTSHGLAQERVGEVAYDVAVLTNLTHEHLEFHRTHEAYRAAKRRLFERLAVSEENPDKGHGKTAVINVDDRWAEEFATAAAEAGARVLTYGTGGNADIRATALEEDVHRLRIRVATRAWSSALSLRLAGRFNAHNALAAIGVADALGLPEEAVRAGLEGLTGVPGRMERIEAGQPFAVIVDYAHTPESLAKVLDGLGPLAAAAGGGLICVFGSAGDRDVVKRPVMGRVAAERCRLIVVTDEDPRGEDRGAILDQIADGAASAGARRGQDLVLEPDRPAAVAFALEAARPGDVVLLAGKGHEQTIEYADGAIAYDEANVARETLARLGYVR